MITKRCFTLIKGLIVLLAVLSLTGGSIAPAYAQSDASWILAQINALRARNGLGPLSMNSQLITSATQHSTYLATNPYIGPHVEGNGSTPQSRMIAAGFTGPIMGENVYGGGLATASIAFNWWVGDAPHLQNMLNSSYDVVGVGIATGPYGQWFTTDFGGTGGGANVAPASGNSAASNNSGAPQAPVATRRPRPTTTPTITFTPSITFTPLPSDTPAPSTTAIPMTPTAIVLEVSPQGAVENPGQNAAQPVVAMLPSITATIQAATPQAVMSQPTLSPTAIVVSNSPPTAGSTRNGLFGTLIIVAIGIQGLIIAGFVVRQLRSR